MLEIIIIIFWLHYSRLGVAGGGYHYLGTTMEMLMLVAVCCWKCWNKL